jgi:hypothetical protein
MKINRLFRTLLLALLSLAAVTASSLAQQTNIFIAPSGTQTGGSNSGNGIAVTFGSSVWQNWYANSDITYTIAFDTNNPPPTGDILGSVLQASSWVTNVNNNNRGLSTFACVDNNFWGGATVDMSLYQSLEMDFKFDTNSTITPASAGNVNITVDQGRVLNIANGITLTNLANGGATVSNFDGNWHHLSIGIPSTIANATVSKGPGFQMFQQLTVFGSFNFWTANLELIARPFVAPPPTVATTPIIPGLWQFADQTPNYNRQDIRTDNNNADFNLDWVGRPKPVTYSWTIGAFPGGSAGGYAADVTITPDPAAGINYADPDWSSTNAIWLAIQVNGDGKVTAGIAWKTNQPAGNSQYYAATNGQIIPYNVEASGLTVPSAVGTWSLTFTSDTAFTLTAPGGHSTNGVFPAFVVAAYTNVSFFLNSTMNNAANVGNYTVYSALNITGVGTPVNETFQGGLNTPFLQLMSQGYGGVTNPPNQIFATTDDALWFHWTLPDNGYVPVSRPLIGSGRWGDLGLTNILLNGSSRWILVPKTNLPSPASGYFAVVKRPYSLLQVLFPGETAAPGTPTGKTGTPNPISISGTGGGFVNITVNAVDSDYNLMTSVTNTLAFTSSDTAASLPASGSVALVGGTAASVTIQLQTQGNQTVTATDLISTNNIHGTSSPVSVTP